MLSKTSLQWKLNQVNLCNSLHTAHLSPPIADVYEAAQVMARNEPLHLLSVSTEAAQVMTKNEPLHPLPVSTEAAPVITGNEPLHLLSVSTEAAQVMTGNEPLHLAGIYRSAVNNLKKPRTNQRVSNIQKYKN